MTTTIGWDIGGAHLKGARAKDGRIVAAAQAATPLWQGLACLDAAFADLVGRLGAADAHGVTMSGELCDAFASRREGVVGLAAIAARHLPAPRLYAGPAGFVRIEEAAEQAASVASANWRASAQATALKVADALFIDIGSTTTDLIPIVGGRVAAIGVDDASRLTHGELVYTGLTRSFVMAMAARAPFAGQWTPLMNEYFASAADVHRLLGELDAAADLMATADGRDKSPAASRARLARMIGREAREAPPEAWRRLAAWFAEAQTRDICDAAFLRLSRGDLAPGAPAVIAGAGEAMAREAARRLGLPSLRFAELTGGGDEASLCAPAAAIALLLANVL
ncbi:MAG TPA: hydantoinase/oxoprolinase family protein [Roseiarcus sp.]|nr:hydantoinase/oxoprolinase family protein [Roseiarcus sp.]